MASTYYSDIKYYPNKKVFFFFLYSDIIRSVDMRASCLNSYIKFTRFIDSFFQKNLTDARMKSHLWLEDMKAIAIRILNIECIKIDNKRTIRLLDVNKTSAVIKPVDLLNELKKYKKSKWREERRQRLKQFSGPTIFDLKKVQKEYRCDPCDKTYAYIHGLIKHNLKFHEGQKDKNSAAVDLRSITEIRNFLILEVFLESYGQRPDVIYNMTLQELTRDGKIENNKDSYLIYVHNHKTSKKFGPAKIILPNDLADEVFFYINKIRPFLLKDDVKSDLVFPTVKGSPLTFFGEIMKLFMEATETEYNIHALDFRRAWEAMIRTDDNMTGTDFSAFSRFRNHSEDSVYRHYVSEEYKTKIQLDQQMKLLQLVSEKDNNVVMNTTQTIVKNDINADEENSVETMENVKPVINGIGCLINRKSWQNIIPKMIDAIADKNESDKRNDNEKDNDIEKDNENQNDNQNENEKDNENENKIDNENDNENESSNENKNDKVTDKADQQPIEEQISHNQNHVQSEVIPKNDSARQNIPVVESSNRQIDSQNINIGGLDLSIPFNSQDNSFLNEAMDDYDIEKVMTNINNEMKTKNNATEQQDLRCKSCEKFFSSAIDLKKHSHSCGVNDESDDDTISTNFSNFEQEDPKKAKKLFTCNYCNQKFMANIALKVHMERCCKFCGKAFISKKYLNSHIGDMHNMHKCNMCEKSFADTEKLTTHINNVHQGNKFHTCRICGKYYPQKLLLTRHVYNVHKRKKPKKNSLPSEVVNQYVNVLQTKFPKSNIMTAAGNNKHEHAAASTTMDDNAVIVDRNESENRNHNRNDNESDNKIENVNENEKEKEQNEISNVISAAERTFGINSKDSVSNDNDKEKEKDVSSNLENAGGTGFDKKTAKRLEILKRQQQMMWSISKNVSASNPTNSPKNIFGKRELITSTPKSKTKQQKTQKASEMPTQTPVEPEVHQLTSSQTGSSCSMPVQSPKSLNLDEMKEISTTITNIIDEIDDSEDAIKEIFGPCLPKIDHNSEWLSQDTLNDLWLLQRNALADAANNESMKIDQITTYDDSITKKFLMDSSMDDQFTCEFFSCVIDKNCQETLITDTDLENHVGDKHSNANLSDIDVNELLLARYHEKSDRLNTFKNCWPKSAISLEKLANAGFIYTRRDDDVQCVFCAGVIGDWADNDDPMIVHQRNFPTCPFIVENIPNQNPEYLPELNSSVSSVSSVSSLDYENLSEQPVLFYKCDLCGNKYFERNRLNRHIKQEHDKMIDKQCNQSENIDPKPNPIEAISEGPNPHQESTILKIKEEQDEIPIVVSAAENKASATLPAPTNPQDVTFNLSTSLNYYGNPDIKPFEFKCVLCNAQFKCLNVYAAIAKSHYSLHIRSKHPFHSLLVDSYLNEIKVPVVKCSKCGIQLRNSVAHTCSNINVLSEEEEKPNVPKYVSECPKCSAFVEEGDMVEHNRLVHVKLD